jgi:NADH:ubiquinone oxidoreductase subunit E
MNTKLEEIYKRFIENDGSPISILQDIQNEFGYLPESAIYWISERTGVPPAVFFGIATFYNQFHLKPRGKNIITICSGTACHVRGSERLINTAKKELNLNEESNTTEDGLFTFEQVNCVGACSIAPVVIMNKKVFGKMSPEKLTKEIKKIKKNE